MDDENVLPPMPKLPTRVTVQVISHDFGPTNIRSFGVTFRPLVGKDIGLQFTAGGGNRDILLGSFQATLPSNFNILSPTEQMKVLSDQVHDVNIGYFCRDTGELRQLGPDNFRRTAVYDNVIDF
jgi:hypothetical protein